MALRDRTYRGLTRSLCDTCRALVPAKVLVRDNRVYFRKQCPEHGVQEDLVWSDARTYDDHSLDEPAKLPLSVAVDGSPRGCPYDCGLCPEHEQHTCVGLIEITQGCNLTCPTCYSSSAPGGAHESFETFKSSVDGFVRREGEPDVLQISGGEPTIHPEIVRMTRYAVESPVQVVMINTNGIRLAQDRDLVRALAEFRHKLEIYLQFDGLSDETYRALRGEPLLDVKLRALDALAEHGLRSTLVCTVRHGVNLHELGALARFAIARPWVRGISYQPASFVGRHGSPPDQAVARATTPDVIRALAEQSDGLLGPADFLPVPCAHPNCHSMAYVYRGGERPLAVSRFLNLRENADLMANTLVYTPAKARAIVEAYLRRGSDCCNPAGKGFVEAALAEKLSGAEVFRITITQFLDAATFDVNRVMKCCIGFLLPSGHTVPFCAYNTLYRDGKVPLPPIARP